MLVFINIRTTFWEKKAKERVMHTLNIFSL